IPSWCAPPTSRIWWATPPSSARRRGGRPGCRWRTCWPRWWMPKRTDLETILIIGSGPIVIGQAAEFDYSGTQAIKALKEEGYKVVLVNSNPATIMTDPELADRTYIEPVTAEWVARVIEREHPDALLPTMGGQTALNVAMALAQDGTLAKYGVEPIGAGRGVAGGGHGGGRGDRVPGHHPAVLHAGRYRWRGGLQPRRVRGADRARAGSLAGPRGAGGAVGPGLEGVRAGGDAGLPRQRGGDLLHRELRSHGRAHGRLDHGRPRHDAHRSRVPGHAGRRHRDHPRDRRRGRRVQHPVCGEPHQRRDAGDRDEPPGLALLGPGVQGRGA